MREGNCEKQVGDGRVSGERLGVAEKKWGLTQSLWRPESLLRALYLCKKQGSRLFGQLSHA